MLLFEIYFYIIICILNHDNWWIKDNWIQCHILTASREGQTFYSLSDAHQNPHYYSDLAKFIGCIGYVLYIGCIGYILYIGSFDYILYIGCISNIL